MRRTNKDDWWIQDYLRSAAKVADHKDVELPSLGNKESKHATRVSVSSAIVQEQLSAKKKKIRKEGDINKVEEEKKVITNTPQVGVLQVQQPIRMLRFDLLAGEHFLRRHHCFARGLHAHHAVKVNGSCKGRRQVVFIDAFNLGLHELLGECLDGKKKVKFQGEVICVCSTYSSGAAIESLGHCKFIEMHTSTTTWQITFHFLGDYLILAKQDNERWKKKKRKKQQRLIQTIDSESRSIASREFT